VQSADYIYKKIKEEDLLSLAFNKLKEVGSEKFPLVRIAHLFKRKSTVLKLHFFNSV
jgi:hypothetical protein